MFKLFAKNTLDRAKKAMLEVAASGSIPYYTHFNKDTLITKNYELIKVIKINGFSFETADDEDLEIRKNMRNQLFKSIASENTHLYFHLVRRRQPAYPDDYASIDMPDGFATYLDQKWVEKSRNKKGFVNELYFSIVRKPLAGPNGIRTWVGRFRDWLNGEEDEDLIINLREAAEELDEAVNRVMNTIGEYSPEVLELEEREDGVYSQPLEFYSLILNGGKKQRIRITNSDVSKLLPKSRMYFGNKAIEFKLPDGQAKFAGMVSIKEYGPKTWPGILDSLLMTNFEFVVTQSFTFINRQKAISAMQLQQDRLIHTGDVGVSQMEEISVALDMAMSGEIGFGQHHLTIMCLADDPKELDNIVSIASVALTNTGGIGIRERLNLEASFWAQLPGNHDFVVRKATINTHNLASFCSFHNYPYGKPKNNHWGDAVTVFDTTSGTPFYFSFHVRDVGHTTIIGPTGSGKTVLMNFLCAQAQKFKCRLFFFDKDRGAEIFIRALDGKYSIIDPGKVCGFNPLQLPDTGENRAFLLEWFKLLLSTQGEQVTSDDIAIINSAIGGNYKLDKADRKLSNIAAFFGLAGPGTLAGRLAMWIGNGSYAKVFNNDLDTIDFGRANVFGFEMGELLRDKAVLGPVLLYIFHRISLSLDGTPSMIVLDEAWALIDNEIFAPKIRDWLKVLRKLNTFVVFATQSVEDASKSQISDTLIQQTATQIFLPNLKATSVYRTAFMLSQREFDLIKTTDPSSRFFLLKQANDSVVARVDLTGMSDLINVLSGRAETVNVLDEVREKVGDNPADWIPVFNKRLKERKD